MTALDHAQNKIEKIIDLLKSSGGFRIEAQIVRKDSERSPDTPRISVNISGEDVSLFVRNNGELIKAVNQIVAATLHLSPDAEDSIWFDVNHLRADRKSQLRHLADDAVTQVRTTQKPYSFLPMLSCERRMLRQALSSSGLKSASDGEGTERCVVLYPDGITPPAGHSRSRLHPFPPGHESSAA